MQAIEQQELNKALAIINDRVLTSWANMKGIYRGYISPYNSSSATDETIRYNILKKGGSLTDKNNELLIKSIKEHNKKIDKLSKTMINYFKDIKKK